MNRNPNTAAKGNQMKMTDDAPNVVKSPPLFQGDIVCFHEIFEWLSLSDIASVGQTCKRLKAIAGDFFKSYLSATELEIEIRDPLPFYSSGPVFRRYQSSYKGFYSYVQTIKVNENNDAIFRRIASIKNGQIKRINFSNTKITHNRMVYIKGILNNIKVIELNCKVNGELYSCLLRFCPNLEHLIVRDVTSQEPYRIVGNNNQWLARKYPKLTHFELLKPSVSSKMLEPEVETFFKLNPQIKSLGFDFMGLWYQSEVLLKSKIQLDVLIIRVDIDLCEDEDLDEAIDLIYKLYDQGFYKRLHVCDTSDERVAAFPGLEGYTTGYNSPFKSGNSLTHLKYLSINGYEVRSVNELLNFVRMVPNIERLNLRYAYVNKFNHALPFLQHCAKIKKMKIDKITYDKVVIDLFAWDRERAKLADAQKVTIFLEEEDFLALKWSNKTINLEFIEVRRANSYEWNKYIH